MAYDDTTPMILVALEHNPGVKRGKMFLIFSRKCTELVGQKQVAEPLGLREPERNRLPRVLPLKLVRPSKAVAGPVDICCLVDPMHLLSRWEMRRDVSA